MSCSVCLFGDSVAKGVVFDSIRRKYHVWKDCFAASIQNQEHVAVSNYSKFGCTVRKGREILEKHGAELSAHNFTVFEFGGNDCDFDWHAVSQNPEGEFSPKTPLEEFTAIYRDMVRYTREMGGTPVMLTLPPIDAPRYFAWISQGENSRNILRWLGDVEHIYRWHEMYNLAVCRVAMEERVPLLDISSRFLAADSYQELLCEDGIHPNEKGHQVSLESLREAARQAVRQTAYQPPRLALA